MAKHFHKFISTHLRISIDEFSEFLHHSHHLGKELPVYATMGIPMEIFKVIYASLGSNHRMVE